MSKYMDTDTKYPKPLPLPDEDSKPYWEGTKQHKLVIQRCKDCGTFRFRPKHLCHKCLSEHTEWTQVSGKGTVWSFIVVHRAMVPGFKEEVPYVCAAVELAEGPRLTANILDCKPEEVQVGAPVEVTFVDVTEEITLPQFRLVR